MKNILKKILKKIKQCIWLGVYAFMQSRRRLHPHLAPRAALLLLHQRGRGVQVHIGVGQGVTGWAPTNIFNNLYKHALKRFFLKKIRFQMAGGLFRQRRKGHDRGDKNIKSCLPPPPKKTKVFLQKILDQPNTTFFLPLKGDGAGGDPEKIARDVYFFSKCISNLCAKSGFENIFRMHMVEGNSFSLADFDFGTSRVKKAFLSRKISWFYFHFNSRLWWWMETTSTSTRTFTATWPSGETTSQGFKK